MSLGNLPTEGQKGYNTPWQRAMIELLRQIKDNTTGSGGLPITLTPSLIRVTTSGTISAGKKGISIYNAGDQNGTVLGTTLEPGEIVDFEVGQDSNSLAAVSYDATNTEFLISTLV